MRLFETKAPDAYPEGTIIRMIPQEAMVKRTKAAFPKTNGWEYFVLAVRPQGTTVRARGRRGIEPGGDLQICHSFATKSDYVCGGGSGCAAVPLTEEQIAQIQRSALHQTPATTSCPET